jgi:serine/threonine protein phosphatase 1
MYENQIEGKVLCISDIHGEYDQVKKMLEFLVKHSITKDRFVVFLGDYVDRGKQTAQTVELLVNFSKFHKQTTFLAGNHCLNLIKALNIVPNPHQDYYFNRIPSRNRETMLSYGVDNGRDLMGAMPDSHKEFFRNLVWGVEHPEYFFVHVGLDPRESYKSQVNQLNNRDMNLFKPKWLHADGLGFAPGPSDCGDRCIVSGHIIRHKIAVSADRKRIGLDTGCGYGGVLSAVALPEFNFYQIAR